MKCVLLTLWSDSACIWFDSSLSLLSAIKIKRSETGAYRMMLGPSVKPQNLHCCLYHHCSDPDHFTYWMRDLLGVFIVVCRVSCVDFMTESVD